MFIKSMLDNFLQQNTGLSPLKIDQNPLLGLNLLLENTAPQNVFCKNLRCKYLEDLTLSCLDMESHHQKYLEDLACLVSTQITSSSDATLLTFCFDSFLSEIFPNLVDIISVQEVLTAPNGPRILFF